MMTEKRKIMSFDWALKTVLRDKANFDVLEGFLSALLKQDVVIEELLESESNRRRKTGKQNRVDLLVKMASGEHVVIEVQYDLEYDFLRRLLYGVSKLIVENLDEGAPYVGVKKVISVSLVHFNIGFHDKDYVYHGTTEFRGIHTKNLMVKEESGVYQTSGMLDLDKQTPLTFPEYYIIPVKHFNGVIEDDLDEWVYSMKNSEVPASFKSQNIDKLRDKLDLLTMEPEKRRQYNNYLLERASDEGVIALARDEAHEEGREEGRVKEREEIARHLMDVLDDKVIAEKTGLPIEQITNLRNETVNLRK